MLRLERQKSFDQQPKARPRAEGWGRGGGEEGIKHRVARGKTTTTQGETRKVHRKFILRQELFFSQSMRNHGLVKLDFFSF